MNRKLFARTIALCLALCMVCGICATAEEAVAETAAAEEPTLTKNGTTNMEITFTKDEILNLFPDSKKINGITVSILPDIQCGTLKLGQNDVLIMQNISKKEIDKLRFIPVKNFEGSITFEIKALDSDKNHLGTAKVVLYLLPQQNFPPEARDGKTDTQKNIQITGKLFGSDPEGDAVTLKVVEEPKKGKLEIDQTTQTFIYSPDENKTGKDVFRYQVEDQFGNLSDVATYTIQINKPATQLTYADMSNHWAHYPAIKLAEKNILRGVEVGGSNIFDPDGEVTRGEFMVMLMQATEQDLPITTVSTTGFADDESIPTWMKGYVAAAVQNDIITGDSTQETAVFEAEAPITRAQACVMLTNALKPQELTTSIKTFADRDAIPDWATEAIDTMYSCGILDGYSDNTVRPTETLTRAQATKFLYEAMNYLEETQENPTFNLFSWFTK